MMLLKMILSFLGLKHNQSLAEQRLEAAIKPVLRDVLPVPPSSNVAPAERLETANKE